MSRNVAKHLLSPPLIGLLILILGGSILALAAESVPDSGAAKPQAALDIKTGRAFWAFERVKKNEPPVVSDADWSKSPIDRFVFAALTERGLKPAPPASKLELVRRVYFDVTGLPPTPEEIQSFINDASPDAYEKLVDRLLASPRFGERWAQHWLDVVRYAETEGFEYDRHLPEAWRYRDYVIDSINRDKPYDRFVAEQVAGDEIAPGNVECESAAIFYRLGAVRRNAGNPDIVASRNEVLTERTDMIGSAFLGLTIGCARCHDHKFDPILQKDYYSLQAYLAATEEHDISLASDEEKQEFQKKSAPIQAQLRQLRRQVMGAQGEQRAKLNEQIEELEDSLPPAPATIPGIKDDTEHRTEIHILKRGEWEKKGDAVGPRPPSVMVADDLSDLPADAPNPRRQLARWLTDPANPLTARVIVNRLWQGHFGTGIVKTANNFGVNGERPTHPQLLDYLAAQLAEEGWHLKPLHRMILLSCAYRQSNVSPITTSAMKIDPDDRYLWRFPRRRLSAEEIRDAMLSASGKLNISKVGGPSVMVPVDKELIALLYKPSQWQVATKQEEQFRRSIYLIAKRNLRLPFMETFDQPALQTSCSRRESSTHAPQALEMLNGRLANEQAAAFAARLEKECGSDHAKIAERAYWLAMGRAPTDREREISLAFLKDQSTKEFALAMYNLNGFLYVQ
jgi:hypothetical protein